MAVAVVGLFSSWSVMPAWPVSLAFSSCLAMLSPTVLPAAAACARSRRASVRPGAAGQHEHPAVGVDLDQGDADVGAPADRVQRDRARVTQHHDPADEALRPRHDPGAAVRADAVVNLQVTVADGQRQPVAVGDEHRATVTAVVEDAGESGCGVLAAAHVPAVLASL